VSLDALVLEASSLSLSQALLGCSFRLATESYDACAWRRRDPLPGTREPVHASSTSVKFSNCWGAHGPMRPCAAAARPACRAARIAPAFAGPHRSLLPALLLCSCPAPAPSHAPSLLPLRFPSFSSLLLFSSFLPSCPASCPASFLASSPASCLPAFLLPSFLLLSCFPPPAHRPPSLPPLPPRSRPAPAPLLR